MPKVTAQEQWNERLKELKQYQQVNGNCKVPRGYKGNPQLGMWVHNQRNKYKKGKLSKERIKLLNKIEFEWEVSKEARLRASAVGRRLVDDQKWNERLKELKQYQQVNGNCKVPQNYKANPVLGKWVDRQRSVYNKTIKGKLSSDQIKQLNGIGFSWNRYEENWNEGFKQLKLYQQVNGNCKVPQNYKAGLGKWVDRQRTAYKKGKLSPEQISRLEDIGFNWSVGHGSVRIGKLAPVFVPHHLMVPCSVEGCTRKASDSGKCHEEHGGYNYCNIDGCQTPRVKNGLCSKHGAFGNCIECGGKNDKSGRNTNLCVGCWSKKVMQAASPLPSLPVGV